MAGINKSDFDDLHKKVDEVREDVSEIKGMLRQRDSSWSVFGILSAIALGVWNLIK